MVCSACKLPGHKCNSRLCRLFQSKPIVCSACKLTGHKSNNKSCTLFQPKLITCSTCKLTGHKSNSRLCGGKPYEVVEDFHIIYTLDIEHQNRCQLINTSCLTQMEIIQRWVSVDYFIVNYDRYRLHASTVTIHDSLCIAYATLLNTKNIIKDKSTPTMDNFNNIIHLEDLTLHNYNLIVQSVNSLFNSLNHFCVFIIENRHINQYTTNINVDLWNFKFKRVIEVKTLSCKQSNFKDTDTHFDCGICFETKSNDNLCLFNQCFQNKHQFCVDCVATFIHSCKNTKNVSCPLCRKTIHQVFTNSKKIKSTVVTKFE